MSKAYYHEISTYYDKDAADYDSRYWSNPVLQQIRQSFREEVKQHAAQAMLEVGFGTGLDLVHFAKIHPERRIYGIDISSEMYRLSGERIGKGKYTNIEIRKGSVEDIAALFPGQKFDIIYIFFGALNTTESLRPAAESLSKALTPGGILVLSFVNKWYIMGMVLDLLRFRFSKAFSRLKNDWGGYSPESHLSSNCYTPRQIRSAFSKLQVIRKRGYCMVHPAWYHTTINQKIRRLGPLLWSIDRLLERTFMWQFGEYALIVFKNRKRLS